MVHMKQITAALLGCVYNGAPQSYLREGAVHAE
jgi:hypothetical protein